MDIQVIKVKKNEEGKILIKLYGTVYEIQVIEDEPKEKQSKGKK